MNTAGKTNCALKVYAQLKKRKVLQLPILSLQLQKVKKCLYEELMEFFFEMENPQIQRITRHLLKKHEAAFLTYPAATRNHHDYVSGLIDHVVSMLKLGKSIG